MILRFSPSSPFARKVRVCLRELQHDLRVDEVVTNPQEDESLRSLNPLCKVPTLVLDDGEALYDSPVICEYLATRAGDTTIVPDRSPDGWRIQRDQALADGLCEAAVLGFRETLRPEGQRSPQFIERQGKAIDAALASLERAAPRFGDRIDIGVIAIGCALGYLDLRHAARNWRASHPALTAWFARFDQRPSMAATRPPAPK